MLSKLLDKLSCSFHYIKWRVCERANFNCFNIRLIQKLMIWRYLDLSIEMSWYYQKFLRGSHCKGDILWIFFTVIHEFLLSVALNHILGIQAIHAVVIEKEEITRVNWFLDLYTNETISSYSVIRSETPIESIIYIWWSCCVLLGIDQLWVGARFPQLFTPIIIFTRDINYL